MRRLTGEALRGLAETHIYVEKCEFRPHTRIMNKQQETKLKKMGIFTRSQAEAMGLSHQSLSRLVEEEKIIRVGRGMYLHSEGNLCRDIDYQVACTKFGPKSVIGGITALFHYNLIEQVPGQVWVLVPPSQLFREHVYGCFFDDAHGLRNIDSIGEDNVTYECDYPHSDSTWPHTKKMAIEQTRGMDPAVVHKIMRGNAIRMLKLEDRFQ